MSAQTAPKLSYFRRVVNVFRFGRPSGKNLPSDQFVDFFQKQQQPLSVSDYTSLRQRFSDEGFFRRERQSNVIGWVSGIMLAIMVALLQVIASGQALPWYVKLLMALMIFVFAFISTLRILHDHSVAQFRSDVCRQLDARLNVTVLDEHCKLPPALHKLFTVMIWALALGVMIMIFCVNSSTSSSAKLGPSSQVKTVMQNAENKHQSLIDVKPTLPGYEQPKVDANAISETPVPPTLLVDPQVNGESKRSAPQPTSPPSPSNPGSPKP